MRLCSSKDCHKKHEARGFCKKHWREKYYNRNIVVLFRNRFRNRILRKIPYYNERLRAWQAEYNKTDKGKESMRKGAEKWYRNGGKEKAKIWAKSENGARYKRQYNEKYYKTPRGRSSYMNQYHKRRAKMKTTNIDSEWLFTLQMKTNICGICNTTLKQPIHLDHIKPLAVGGNHERGNVRFVHAVCNLRRPKDGSDLCEETLDTPSLPFSQNSERRN